jgi:di/tricarboxylate transporter
VVLRYLPSRLSAAEIADELSLSVHTVKSHQRNLYRKLSATSRREAVDRARQLQLLIGMVALLATGVVPPSVAGLLAAGAMVLTGVLTVEQAYRAVNWTVVVLIGAMIPLSVAMQVTGAAEQVAHGLVAVVGGAGPYLLLLGVFLLTAAFGQLISNTATAPIVIPIAVSAASELGVSVRPVLMCVAVAAVAVAAYLTPVATPVNLMVMAPGGYRFGDYWKLGLPLLGLAGVVAVLLVPVFWRF